MYDAINFMKTLNNWSRMYDPGLLEEIKGITLTKTFQFLWHYSGFATRKSPEGTTLFTLKSKRLTRMTFDRTTTGVVSHKQ